MRVAVGDHELAVEVEGIAPPDFVCLHGLADTASVWRKLVPELARRGRVVALDQRAHGASDPAPPTTLAIADLAADAIALLDQLEIPRAILIGHSMGGIVAMTAALTAPARVAALVLLGTTSQVSARTAMWYRSIAQAGESGGTDGLRRAIFGEGSRREIRGDPRGMVSLVRSLAGLHERPLTAALEQLRCPTVLLAGAQDPMGPAASEIIAAHLPGAVLEVLPGGHWLHLETPDRVLAAIDRLLPRAASSR